MNEIMDYVTVHALFMAITALAWGITVAAYRGLDTTFKIERFDEFIERSLLVIFFVVFTYPVKGPFPYLNIWLSVVIWFIAILGLFKRSVREAVILTVGVTFLVTIMRIAVYAIMNGTKSP